MKCVIENCQTNVLRGDEIVFFSFPNEPQRRDQWLRIISSYISNEINGNKNNLICSRHFDESHIINSRGRRTLCGNAVPRITGYSGSADTEPCATCITLRARIKNLKARFERSQSFLKTMVCTEYDFDHSCGVCAVNNERLCRLSVDNEEMLKSFVSNLQFDKNRLPSEMCVDCINRLELSHAFKYQYENAQLAFMKHSILECERAPSESNSLQMQNDENISTIDNSDVEMSDISFHPEVQDVSRTVDEIAEGNMNGNERLSNGNADKSVRNGFLVHNDIEQNEDKSTSNTAYDLCVAEITEEPNPHIKSENNSKENFNFLNFDSPFCKDEQQRKPILMKFGKFSDEELQLGEYGFSIDDAVIGFRIVYDTIKCNLVIEPESGAEIDERIIRKEMKKDWSNLKIDFIPIVNKNVKKHEEIVTQENSNCCMMDESEEEEELCIIEIKEEPLDLDSEDESSYAEDSYRMNRLSSYY